MNKARCKKCNDIIESRYVHEFVTCKCGSISVDGGPEYKHRLYPSHPKDDWIEELDERTANGGGAAVEHKNSDKSS